MNAGGYCIRKSKPIFLVQAVRLYDDEKYFINKVDRFSAFIISLSTGIHAVQSDEFSQNKLGL
jgi:hypothetical protein